MIRLLLLLPALLYSMNIKELTMQYHDMSYNQKKVLQKSYNLGKEFNVGLTLAAIAWQESDAGKYKINLQTNDCGVYQKNVPYFLKGQGIERSGFRENMWCQRFVDDIDFSAAVAVTDLLWWKQRNSWWKTWESYHCGYGSCPKYARDISLKIQVLKKELLK